MTTINGHPRGCARCGQPHRTAWQVLLLAAWQLEEDHRAHFSTGDLAVESARIAPLTFCLKSAEGHLLNAPDNNRVIVELIKCADRGLFEKVRPRVYRLTDAGRETARGLVPAVAKAVGRAGGGKV